MNMTFLLIIGYCGCFLIFGLFFAIQALKRNFFPKEFLYIASIAFSLIFSYIFFYSYYYSYNLGHDLLKIYLLVSVVLLILILREVIKNKKSFKIVKAFFLVPLLITLAFLLVYTHIFTGCRNPKQSIDISGEVQNSSYCQISWLPIDNALPFIYAQNLLHHEIRAKVVDWSIADRPPLQIGAVLPVVDIGKFLPQSTKYTAYYVFSIFLQLSWVGLLWGIFAQLIKARFYRVGLIVGFGCLGFFYINSVFVWPKLLSASLVTFGIYLLLNVRGTKRHLFEYRYIIMAAVAISLGLLAHQGVVFTVAALALMMVFEALFKRPLSSFNWKPAIVALIVALILLVPWQITVSSLTSSNRLVKWQFAGVISASDKRGTVETIVQQYKKLSFGEWLEDKRANLFTIYDGNVGDSCKTTFTNILNDCHLHSWRDHTFFSSFFAFEFYIFGFLIIIWQLIKKRLDKFDKTILTMALLALIIWILLMYIPGSTYLHQGSYATMLLLFILIGKKLVTLPKYMFFGLTILQVTLFYAAWIQAYKIHLI